MADCLTWSTIGKCILSLAMPAITAIGNCILPQAMPTIKSHFDYWWCFDNNIQDLKNGIRDLERQKHHIEHKKDEARVEKWLKASTDKLKEAQKISLSDDNIPKECNLISRYSLGKNAKKTAEEIAKLLNDEIFNPRRSTTNFESRKSIEKNIIDSLQKSGVDVIGICGMPGVGKTTMAKRIKERLEEENLFHDVVMVTVSQTKDVLEIQNEIAESLDLKLDVESIPARAKKLSTRLMDRKRKIIILDDVWDPSLIFEGLGIHIESNVERCKVLLTSRSKDCCNGIKNIVVFNLKILEDEEAWILFKEKAGECVEDSSLRRVAKDVVKKCKGLPLALVTVGIALHDNRNISIWEDSLKQLRQSNPKDFQEVLTNVYQPLKLSYDRLENDREKHLFLMCCLFPEDYNISIEQLTWYSFGLRLFDDITNIKEARNRTHRLVEKLESRFLLIYVDGCNGRLIKMHDVVRDVAIYIGSEAKMGFLKSLRRTSVENSSDVNCNWMSVDISNEQMEVPVLSRFPKLRLLMLRKLSYNQFSDISFEGMKNINVLSFQSTKIRSLPLSLESLKNLQTLRLFRCQVQNISVISKLTSLKILSCCECYDITELPAEIGKLNDLRLLELDGCRGLQRIPFGIISSLFLLEELKIRYSFSEWETGGERGNASLRELQCLPNLTCLEIEISDCTSSSQDILLSQKLVRYRISIPADDYFYFEERDYDKVMNVNLSGAVGNWIQILARNAEFLSLRGDGSDNINLAEMENLRNLKFINCSKVKRLVDSSYLNQNVLLCNLKSIYISGCSNIKHVFSVSVATTRLLQLEVLWIENCAAMEQVFWNEIRYDTFDCIEFPKLKELILSNLPNLTAFCQGLENIVIKFPNLAKMKIVRLPKLNSLSPLNSETVICHDEDTCFHLFCNPKVEMGGLKIMTIWGLEDTNNIRNICCSQIPDNVFNNLEKLTIGYMNGIRSLMSTSIAKNLVSLKDLTIDSCKDMVEVIENDYGDDKQVVDMIESDYGDDKLVVDIKCLFPNLKVLTITSMPKLRRFLQWNHTLELPLLEQMDIYNCTEMDTFTSGYIKTPNIRKINEQIDFQKNLNHAIHDIWTTNKSIAEETRFRTTRTRFRTTRTGTMVKPKMSTTMRM